MENSTSFAFGCRRDDIAKVLALGDNGSISGDQVGQKAGGGGGGGISPKGKSDQQCSS